MNFMLSIFVFKMTDSVIKACIDRFRNEEPSSPHHRKPVVSKESFWWLHDEDGGKREGKSSVISEKFNSRINSRSAIEPSTAPSSHQTVLGRSRKMEPGEDFNSDGDNDDYDHEENDSNDDEVIQTNEKCLNIKPLGYKNSTSRLMNDQQFDDDNGHSDRSTDDDDDDDDGIDSEFYRQLLRKLRHQTDKSKRSTSQQLRSSILSLSALSSSAALSTLRGVGTGFDVRAGAGVRARGRVSRALKPVRVKLPTAAPTSNHVSASASVTEPEAGQIGKEGDSVTNNDPSAVDQSTDNSMQSAVEPQGQSPEPSNTGIFLYLSGSDSDSEAHCDGGTSRTKRRTNSQTTSTTGGALNSQPEAVAVSPRVDRSVVEPYLDDPLVAQLWEHLVIVREYIHKLSDDFG